MTAIIYFLCSGISAWFFSTEFLQAKKFRRPQPSESEAACFRSRGQDTHAQFEEIKQKEKKIIISYKKDSIVFIVGAQFL